MSIASTVTRTCCNVTLYVQTSPILFTWSDDTTQFRGWVPIREELDINQVQCVLSKANITPPFVRYVTHHTHVWKECGVWHFQFTIQGCTVSVRCELWTCSGPFIPEYRGADKSLARPTSRWILFDDENISFDASLVIYINSTNIPPIMIINGYTNIKICRYSLFPSWSG